MARMGPWGSTPDATAHGPRLPFLMAEPRALRPAGRPARRDGAPAGLAARRDALMGERERLSGEIEYADAQSLPRARETALNAAVLAEGRLTEGAFERAKDLAGKVESMMARRAGLQKELGDVKAKLCEALMGIADAQGAGGRR